MNPQIQNLASLMREKKRRGEKFVVMLGAGASMSSGIKRTPDIMEELLGKYGRDLTEGSVDARFDKLWRRTGDNDREMYLEPYLEATPSLGYEKLVELIEAEYIDLILTFNFDNLVEQALHAAGFDDYQAIRRGDHNEDAIGRLLEQRKPRFKLFKLHGSVRGSQHFLFASEEMLKYPDAIESLVKSITSRDIIVVGYAFEDPCVVKAFSVTGGSVVSVNPYGVPKGLRGHQAERRSEHFDIKAGFDDFFDQLTKELLQAPTAQEQEKPTRNPFKFLESYEEADRDWLMERGEETAKFMAGITSDPPPQVIVLWGDARVGKTSLVKAALIPALEAVGQRAVYLRCRKREFAGMLNRDLSNLGLIPAGTPIGSSLNALAQSQPRRTVLFLDQFDRVTSAFPWRTREGSKQLDQFLQENLLGSIHEQLTLVLVITDENGLGGTLLTTCRTQRVSAIPVQCYAFEKQHIITIITALAQKAGIEFFDPRIIEQLASRYEERSNVRDPNARFTLAHVQAVCHLLARTRRVDYSSYETLEDNFEALHQAINVCDIINFVEDFSWPDSVWLRNIIKVPLRKKKEQIADFIIQHYDELLPTAIRTPPASTEEVLQLLQPVSARLT